MVAEVCCARGDQLNMWLCASVEVCACFRWWLVAMCLGCGGCVRAAAGAGGRRAGLSRCVSWLACIS
jgi:hypothetical protein